MMSGDDYGLRVHVSWTFTPPPKQPLGLLHIFFSKTSLVCRTTAPRVYGSSSNADDGVVMRAYLCACQVEQLQLCIYFPSTWATFVPLRLALLAARSTIMSMLKDPTWTHDILCLCGLAQILCPRMVPVSILLLCPSVFAPPAPNNSEAVVQSRKKTKRADQTRSLPEHSILVIGDGDLI